jgi:hypothetical protein
MRLFIFPLTAGLLGAALIILSQAVSTADATPPSGTPGIIETFAGGGSNTGNDIPALDAQVVPVSLAIAPNGDLYMSEFSCRIRKVSGGIVSAVVGGDTCGYAGDGGPAVGAEMSRPSAFTFDDTGNMYIADSWNCAVRRVDAVTGIITTVAGHPPCDTYSYTDPLGVPATDAHLSHLGGIAVDSSGIYVSETDTCRIDRISGGMIERYAGAPLSGPPWNCTADGDGPALTQHLAAVYALAVDGDGALLLNGGSTCAVRKVSGGMISTVTANACWPYMSSDILGFAQGLRDIYLAEPDSCHVRALRGTSVYDMAGLSSPISPCGYSGDGGIATEAKLDQPAGVAVDSAGNLYIADLYNNRVRVVYGADLDTDDDGIDDASEAAHSCLDVNTADATDDADSDGLDNLSEVLANTNPCSEDTDSDGLRDPFELAHVCLDPQLWDWTEGDWDSDGLTNLQEQTYGTDPCVADADTDSDSVPDSADNCPTTPNTDQLNTDADSLGDVCDPDDDNDGVADAAESNTGTYVDETDTGTNPLLADTDADACGDGAEPPMGLNPTDPWDFYSVPVPALIAAPIPVTAVKDQSVSGADAQAVFAYARKGAKTGTLEYEQDLNGNGIKDGIEYDRTFVAPGVSGPPDGVVTGTDAQLAFAQAKLGYHC